MERRYPPVQIRLYRSVYTPRFSAGNRVELKKEKKERKRKERKEERRKTHGTCIFHRPPVFLSLPLAASTFPIPPILSSKEDIHIRRAVKRPLLFFLPQVKRPLLFFLLNGIKFGYFFLTGIMDLFSKSRYRYREIYIILNALVLTPLRFLPQKNMREEERRRTEREKESRSPSGLKREQREPIMIPPHPLTFSQNQKTTPAY